ncbi:hypothetical protein RJT34_27002 [Clitoria ternatea]|uniref:Uncharacterized protein n=1 Tax=Clitoria ternatea TaxID=43366 RepID=A0AAN9F7T2_CLITE
MILRYARACHYLALRIKVDKPYPTFFTIIYTLHPFSFLLPIHFSFSLSTLFFFFSLFLLLLFSKHVIMKEDCKRKRESHDLSELATHPVDSPGSKIPRVESESDPDVNSDESHLIRVDSSESGHDPVLGSEDQLQDDIFSIFDDSDNVPERDSVLGLDSVIKSFEDEINAPSLDSGDPNRFSESGELQANLGYLLEASDDELGLPPTVAQEEVPGRVGSEGMDLTGFMGFEDDVFGFGTGFVAECDGGNGGFVTADGLFDYAEPAADALWRSESLQAM